MTLVEFLRARLAEDEAEARAAQDVRSDYHAWHQVMDLRAAGMDERDALHIVTHSPARVLADVEAKRRIIDRYEAALNAYDTAYQEEKAGYPEPPLAAVRKVNSTWDVLRAMEATVRLLAQPYAGHPDYREEWRP